MPFSGFRARQCGCVPQQQRHRVPRRASEAWKDGCCASNKFRSLSFTSSPLPILDQPLPSIRSVSPSPAASASQHTARLTHLKPRKATGPTILLEVRRYSDCLSTPLHRLPPLRSLLAPRVLVQIHLSVSRDNSVSPEPIKVST
jgi:hypothetical protein